MTGAPLRELAGRFQTADQRVRQRASEIVRRTASDVESRARILAPVDTGFLRSSINTNTASSFGNEIVAQVTPTAHYAVYQEHGTSRGVPAVGFMQGAADAVRPSFESALSSIGGETL